MQIDVQIIITTGIFITSVGTFITSILNLLKTKIVMLDQKIIKENIKTEKELIRSLIHETMTQEQFNLLKEKGNLEEGKLYMIQDKPSSTK